MNIQQENFDIDDYFRRVWWNPIIGGNGSSRWWIAEDVRKTGPYDEIEVAMRREDEDTSFPHRQFWVRLNRHGIPKGFIHYKRKENEEN